jgi:hypothetical protein
MTPICGISSKVAWIIEVAVVTMPDGIVKRPEMFLPRNSVFKLISSKKIKNNRYTANYTDFIKLICLDRLNISKYFVIVLRIMINDAQEDQVE